MTGQTGMFCCRIAAKHTRIKVVVRLSTTVEVAIVLDCRSLRCRLKSLNTALGLMGSNEPERRREEKIGHTCGQCVNWMRKGRGKEGMNGTGRHDREEGERYDRDIKGCPVE